PAEVNASSTRPMRFCTSVERSMRTSSCAGASAGEPKASSAHRARPAGSVPRLAIDVLETKVDPQRAAAVAGGKRWQRTRDVDRPHGALVEERNARGILERDVRNPAEAVDLEMHGAAHGLALRDETRRRAPV